MTSASVSATSALAPMARQDNAVRVPSASKSYQATSFVDVPLALALHVIHQERSAQPSKAQMAFAARVRNATMSFLTTLLVVLSCRPQQHRRRHRLRTRRPRRMCFISICNHGLGEWRVEEREVQAKVVNGICGV